MTIIENEVNKIIKAAFEEAGYDLEPLGVKLSAHADFQCNDSLSLAKILKKNPRDIAKVIADNLTKNDIIESAEIAGPGFINITMTNQFLSSIVEQISADDKHGFIKNNDRRKVMLDYGGPNMAKVMHVGHLRSFIIGQAVKNIVMFCGDDTISDIHLGDWGTPIGKIINELKIEEPNLPYFNENITSEYPKKPPVDVKRLGELYVKANIRCNESEESAKQARITTSELQKGKEGYIALWKHFREISIDDIKEQSDLLGVDFTYWNGESEAQSILDNELLEKIEPYTEISQGARIISLEEFETNKPLPPVIIEKTDGGYTYHSSDMASIYRRVNEYEAEEIIYFVDKRQALHFEQVFLACEKAKIINSGFPIKFCGFGTVNGTDGKPFKTRDGNVATLRSLLDTAFDKAKSILPEPNEKYSEEQIDVLAKQISIGAIKFNDMKNSRMSDYIFDMEDAISFEGKTGPYMQYAVARINSILDKSSNLPLTEEITIQTKEERALALQLDAFSNAVNKAYEEKDPCFIADYAYNLAKSFSSFYTACPIISCENEKYKLSRLHLAKCIKGVLTESIGLLGIEAPHEMLKRPGLDKKRPNSVLNCNQG